MKEDLHSRKSHNNSDSKPFRDLSDPVRSAFIFSINRHITILYKRYINLIEDMKVEHSLYTSKINKRIDDPEFLKNIEYFDDKKYNYIRKKILDLGNETIREIENFSSFVDIQFRENPEEKDKE